MLVVGIVLVATIGGIAGVVAADSVGVQQQSTPINNSSNESLTDTVATNSSNVSTVSAANSTTTTSNATTTNNTTTGPTSNGNEKNTTSTTTPVAVNESGIATPDSPSSVRFAFPNQTTNGTSITVREPRLPDGGFLVVHGRSYPQNGLGSVIGVSEYIAPDTSYSRVQIRLFDIAGRSFEQSRLRAPTTMYVQAVLDTNDNQQYDALATTGAQDVSYLIDGSRPAVAGAQIDVEQRLTTENGSEGLMDGFVPNQTQTPASTDNGTGTTTPGEGLKLNPNQGSGVDLEAIPNAASDFGPLLVILGGLAAALYAKSQ
ncbi:DUF7282 domain-containing protein [Halococcus saccharolyticus]|uniref:DUF7282 domain-containing protein n=1 Tax=Halococcus saccharolyticus DSM 5350 TaxID=1227455 RepID=M0MCS6_9EURY|nr:hypothetical protein [Halococcus saccharolyticus]EMA43526.1 hypothetical protein C449_13232 [Halococcus saccharolyticus DSM 5350]